MRCYKSKSVYTPKQVSKTGLLTGLKIASIDQTKKVTFEASLVPAYAGKLTTYASKAEKSFDSFWNLVDWIGYAGRFRCNPMNRIRGSSGPAFFSDCMYMSSAFVRHLMPMSSTLSSSMPWAATTSAAIQCAPTPNSSLASVILNSSPLCLLSPCLGALYHAPSCSAPPWSMLVYHWSFSQRFFSNSAIPAPL